MLFGMLEAATRNGETRFAPVTDRHGLSNGSEITSRFGADSSPTRERGIGKKITSLARRTTVSEREVISAPFLSYDQLYRSAARLVRLPARHLLTFCHRAETGVITINRYVGDGDSAGRRFPACVQP